ncbi:hypothetical protein HOD20_08320 [archaeon]|jgi:hypothetical protein|nr:hypothetical protein [archaeon]MBT4352513.1 hypothetical protein [archaeon]MBT4646888.1 hypothetical protein [archaeon]MBT6822133.1 hypothetical protein [archaeon]MBT7392976.1 hypothetical protein [archaeon]
MDEQGNNQDQNDNSMNSFIENYQNKIKSQLNPTAEFKENKKLISGEYLSFKNQYLPTHMNLYEKGCKFAEKVLKVSPGEKDKATLERSVSICHLDITPTGALSFAILFPLIYILAGSLISFLLTTILLGTGSFFFIAFFVVTGIIIFVPLQKLPMIYANNWRLKASNQMVLCVFYIVSFMRHTSNLELALKFTTDHLSPPLSLDLKKVIWNVETEKYAGLKDALEDYLETWREFNMEFVEAIHLIEGSLYEASEDRRLAAIEKGLALILEETYEKMLHYAQELKSPMTMLHMMGIILPILGLVILPLVVSFMDGVYWWHISTIYNVSLPIGVYYLAKIILSKRPTGYGDTDITKMDPNLKKYKNLILKLGKKEFFFSPFVIVSIFTGIFVLIGFSPLIMHSLDKGEEPFDIIIDNRDNIKVIHTLDESIGSKYALLGYKREKTGDGIIGPFGLGATILSFFLVLGIGLGLGMYYRMTTGNLIKIRQETKELEAEFASAIFQLGGRLGDGLPSELAFGRVATLVRDTKAGRFFTIISNNISQRGMDVEKALFDPKVGAIVQYPSNLIKSSMKVFVQSARKGPKIASQTLINISVYIKEMHKVDERLKDLMSDVISSMKSQISFLTPTIAGVVIGITSMITTVLGKLGQQMEVLGKESGQAAGGMGSLLTLFGDSVPTYYFQAIVGIYVIQLVYILTVLVSNIQNGVDTLTAKYLLGQNLVKSTIMYVLIAFVVTMIFSSIASVVLSGVSLV